MCPIINQAMSLLMKHVVIDQRNKAPNFSAFHWSPHGSLVSIGQYFVTNKGSTFTKKDRNKLNYRFGPKRALSANRIRLYGPCIAAIAG